MSFLNSRWTFGALPPVFYMPRTAGRGNTVGKTLEMLTTQYFMPFGELLVSFILITIHVSLEIINELVSRSAR